MTDPMKPTMPTTRERKGRPIDADLYDVSVATWGLSNFVFRVQVADEATLAKMRAMIAWEMDQLKDEREQEDVVLFMRQALSFVSWAIDDYASKKYMWHTKKGDTV